MLTEMTDAEWEIVVEAFRAARSHRGGAAKMTANSWRRCIISRFTTSPGEPCRHSLASGTASGSGFGG